MFSLQKGRENGHIIFKVKEGTWNKVSQKLYEEVNKVNPNAIVDLVNMGDTYNEYMKSENTLSKLWYILLSDFIMRTSSKGDCHSESKRCKC